MCRDGCKVRRRRFPLVLAFSCADCPDNGNMSLFQFSSHLVFFLLNYQFVLFPALWSLGKRWQRKQRPGRPRRPRRPRRPTLTQKTFYSNLWSLRTLRSQHTKWLCGVLLCTLRVHSIIIYAAFQINNVYPYTQGALIALSFKQLPVCQIFTHECLATLFWWPNIDLKRKEEF